MFEPCENFSDLVVFVALKLDERLVGKCLDGYFFQLCKLMVGGKHGAQLVQRGHLLVDGAHDLVPMGEDGVEPLLVGGGVVFAELLLRAQYLIGGLAKDAADVLRNRLGTIRSECRGSRPEMPR